MHFLPKIHPTSATSVTIVTMPVLTPPVSASAWAFDSHSGFQTRVLISFNIAASVEGNQGGPVMVAGYYDHNGYFSGWHGRWSPMPFPQGIFIAVLIGNCGFLVLRRQLRPRWTLFWRPQLVDEAPPPVQVVLVDEAPPPVQILGDFLVHSSVVTHSLELDIQAER